MKTLLRSLSLSVLAALALPVFAEPAPAPAIANNPYTPVDNPNGTQAYVYVPVQTAAGAYELVTMDPSRNPIAPVGTPFVFKSLNAKTPPSGSLGIAVSQDGSTLYVTDGNNNFYVLSGGESPQQLGQLPPLSPSPKVTPQMNALALSPDGKTVYITDYANNAIYVVDVSTPTAPKLLSIISEGSPTATTMAPFGIAADPRSAQQGFVYVVNSGSTGVPTGIQTPATLSVIEPNGSLSPNPLTLGAISPYPTGIALVNSGTNEYAYVTTQTGGYVSVIDVTDPATPSQISSIPTWPMPAMTDGYFLVGVAANANNTRVYVADCQGQGGSSQLGSVHVIDVAKQSIINTIQVSTPEKSATNCPFGIAVLPTQASSLPMVFIDTANYGNSPSVQGSRSLQYFQDTKTGTPTIQSSAPFPDGGTAIQELGDFAG